MVCSCKLFCIPLNPRCASCKGHKGAAQNFCNIILFIFLFTQVRWIFFFHKMSFTCPLCSVSDAKYKLCFVFFFQGALWGWLRKWWGRHTSWGCSCCLHTWQQRGGQVWLDKRCAGKFDIWFFGFLLKKSWSILTNLSNHLCWHCDSVV